eukprot:scaffold7328_cov314-Pinguiococcus_pyrenoidosus.AAC.28
MTAGLGLDATDAAARARFFFGGALGTAARRRAAASATGLNSVFFGAGGSLAGRSPAIIAAARPALLCLGWASGFGGAGAPSSGGMSS